MATSAVADMFGDTEDCVLTRVTTELSKERVVKVDENMHIGSALLLNIDRYSLSVSVCDLRAIQCIHCYFECTTESWQGIFS
ncbi:Uncharacterised protein [Mycobacteroides abscessus subsp. bolletii]|nr:Uncharacterised protein [Mycobacteroides abscessus subsp. bolletii]SIJ69099.1 Uncharacterised protein [Mycobacteroides abscessus subsp. bolletii]SKT28379.1 Uncharacterised protein [Mycobacteroides abscessus subsp. bolletii]SKT32953.1 Uncharacterised protein [Mycobacteroides abscessus subsp. bolletii]SLD66116.1 Uncharacterised protein [Mycobacteroides abscessus subsp. bolletii]